MSHHSKLTGVHANAKSQSVGIAPIRTSLRSPDAAATTSVKLPVQLHLLSGQPRATIANETNWIILLPETLIVRL